MVLDVPNPPQTQSEMTRHLLAKSGEKMHFCSECEESFDQAGNLTSHLATHIKEENFTCVQCNRSFGQAGNLKRHLLIPGLHNSFHPIIRDGSTWSKFGASGGHGDFFLFSNLGALLFSENCALVLGEPCSG